MYDDSKIHIPDLLKIVRKQKEATLREHDELKYYLNLLQSVSHVKKCDGSQYKLTESQRKFVHCLLSVLVRLDMPKMNDLFKVYDLDISDKYYFDDEWQPANESP